LSQALAADLGELQGYIDDMNLVDFAVRITGDGTEAVTRVVIDSEDGQGRQWTTVGVSSNIIDASFDALIDAIAGSWSAVRAPVPDGLEAWRPDGRARRPRPLPYVAMAAPPAAEGVPVPPVRLQPRVGLGRAARVAHSTPRRDTVLTLPYIL
jgi:hypothetical protein